ncbi:hypothetical protein [Sphingopyxis flava]|uniref:Uncharacterized protein n=1 Tax=Sphingopyxis flava TaxID=1507287 RepID=A0A1T5ACF5_9SPHN|nr:hypothetical protein [Sphingopyxis flava]SKB32373.1 hypothetical protein SAMN06295937_100372 [Sphingopyxis flava]
MSQSASTYAFAGGLDLVSAALAVPPSRLIAGMNYEPLAEGYGRVDGYERFDGRPSPSTASYWLLPFDGGAIAITAGTDIVGGTSGATGRVIVEPVDFTGSWGSGTAAGTLILTNVSGDFVDNEEIRVAGVARALAAGPSTEDSAPTETARSTYLKAAQAYRRALIDKVPGQGPVRGVFSLFGDTYAIRDNVGATQGKLYKATASGWTVLTLGYRLTFTTGLLEIVEGETLTGGTSGATVRVDRLVKNEGDWGTDAAGYIIATLLTGTLEVEALKRGGDTVATLTAIAPVTLPPGGKYRTIGHNFYGSADRYAIYAASGVGPAFEFDGTVLTPIDTGMDDDRPVRVFEIAQHLGLVFRGGSVQISSIGEPLLWDAVQDASEIGFGTEVTDVVQANETAVVLFGQQKIGILTGRDSDTFQLEELTEEAGSEPDTAQRVGQTIYIDRRGMRSLTATQAFGNFKTGTLSLLIEPYFRSKRRSGATTVLSYVSRTKSQYRLIWSDGTGLSVYMGGKVPEAIPFALGMQPYVAVTTELDDGTEGIFVGAEDGYVYRIDSGTSQDGEPIKGFVMTPFNGLGAPLQDDRVFKLVLEMQAPANARIGVTAQFDYGDGQQPIAGNRDFTVQGAGDGIDFLVAGGGGDWSIAAWNEFFWSSPVEGLAEAYVDGIGRNVSFIIAADSDELEDPHILQAYTVYHSRRKLRR